LLTGRANQQPSTLYASESILDYQYEEAIESESLNPVVIAHQVTFTLEIDEDFESPEGAGRRPMVALTFDDGPHIHTDYILDLLYEHNSRATFFVLGDRVEPWRDTIIRMHSQGNEVANHSWNHANMGRLNQYNIQNQIINTSAAIESVVGYSVPILRPPYGITTNGVRQAASELGYAIINWNVDTMDWRYRDPDRIYNVIMDRAKDGSVILMHDIHATTAEAMIRVIPSLVEAGFDLVTVSELLEYFHGELEAGRVYGIAFDD